MKISKDKVNMRKVIAKDISNSDGELDQNIKRPKFIKESLTRNDTRKVVHKYCLNFTFGIYWLKNILMYLIIFFLTARYFQNINPEHSKALGPKKKIQNNGNLGFLRAKERAPMLCTEDKKKGTLGLN